jgi:RNA polymerase-interacting CarD/CdnL/TRCF family regulator
MSKTSSSSFAVSERVIHPIYGTGTIADLTATYTIKDFDKGGRKKFVTSMVQLEATSVEAPVKPASRSRAKKAKTSK